MLPNRLRLLLLSLALTLLPGSLGAAFPKQELAPEERTFTGQLLIASPGMRDPRFQRTVVLIVRHDRNGALGITINRPVGERSLATLMQAMGDSTVTQAKSVRIFAGGPVQPELGFVIHSADYQRPETIDIDGRLAMTASREILRDIGGGKGPQQSLIAFGYAGWAPGQLEAELAHRAWVTAPADTRLIFEADRDKLWDDAYAQRTQDL